MNVEDYYSRGCNQVPKPNNKTNTAFCKGCCKLDETNWLDKIQMPESNKQEDFVKIRFKNSHKDIFKKPIDLPLEIGDIVAVEANPGHDIGIVTMIGELVLLELNALNINRKTTEFKKVYRRAKSTDVEKWISAMESETPIMHKTRKIAADLGLQMKVSDVEYQGDKTKAIFYYSADERVDFREMIKLLAEQFSIRIEMKQIGVRQEASRLGGIGSCGREICCSSWMTDFKSVSTNSARTQQLPLSPQKLAGQCSKLKCCLNFEYDSYHDAIKEFPNTDLKLKTKKGEAFFQKLDVYKRILWYSYTSSPHEFIPMTIESVKKVIELNKKNNFPPELVAIAEEKQTGPDFENVVGQDSLTRFDKHRSKR